MPEPTSIGTAYLISPDGKTKKMFTEYDISGKLAEGWSMASGQTVGTTSDRASPQRITGESYESQLRQGDYRGLAPAEELHGEFREKEREEKYSDRGIEAAALGAARGLTFGASDLALEGTGLVGQETLEGLGEYNVGASLAGEFIPLVATTVATGGTGLAARALQKTPAGFLAAKTAAAGAKSTKAFIAANAAESFAYGVGHNVSQIAIHNEPLTAENIVWNSMKNGLYAGAFGGAGAATFKGVGKLYSKGREALKKVHPSFDMTTDAGAAYMRETSRHFQDGLDMGDDLFKKTNPNRFEKTMTELSDQAQWEKSSWLHLDDVTSRMGAYRKKFDYDVQMPKPPKPVAKPVDYEGRISALEQELEVAMRGPMGIAKDSPAVIKEAGMVLPHRGAWQLGEETSRVLGKTPKGVRKAAMDRSLKQHMAAKAEGSLPFSAGRHPKEIFSELEKLKKLKKPAGPQQTEAEFAKYQRDLSKYEDALETAQTLAANNKVALELADATLERLAQQKKYYQAARSTKGRGGVKSSENFVTAKDLPGHGDIMVAAKKLLRDGDAGEYAKYFKDSLAIANDIAARAATKIPAATGSLRKDYAKSAAALREVMGGDTTGGAIAKLLNGGPEDAQKFIQAADEHYKAARLLAEVADDPKAIAAIDKAYKALGKHADSALTPEMIEATKHIDLGTVSNMAGAGSVGLDYLVEGGPLDSLAKAVTVMALLRAGKGQVAKVAAKGKGRKIAEDIFGAGVAGASRGSVKGSGIPAYAARSMAGMMGHKGASALTGGWGAASLFQASGRANSEVAQAVKRLLSGTVRASMGGAGAKASLHALKFSDDADKRSKESEEDLAALFRRKSEQLIKMTANPQQLAQVMYENTKDLRDSHSTLGDKTEVGMGKGWQYVAERMPKDPGNQHVMGKSTWRPSDLEIQKFANVVAGVMDPIGTFDGITSGHISIESAQAMRAVYPETFAKLQVEVAKNADAIREKLDYDSQNRLSVFMGVPVNSTNTPEYRKWVVGIYVQEQTASQEASKGVDANALLQGTPTQAQQLQKRGAK